MQPYFFPYIGYFQLMNRTERWIVLDHVQFIDKGWINRNRILHPDHKKEWQYMTIPLHKRGQFDRICEVSVKSDIDWRKNILGKLTFYKRVAPHYRQTVDFVMNCFDTDETNLARLVIGMLKKTSAHLGISTPIEIQSEMNLSLAPIEHPGQWALRIAQELGATEYLNPEGGKNIFRPCEFDDLNIKLTFFSAKPNPYPQKRPNFVAGLSIVDVLMWNDIEELRDTFKNNK